MKIELQLADEFGPRLADGGAAVSYRLSRMDPYFDLCEQITLNFTGVRIANSSFINALITGAIEQHGEKALNRLVFKGCNQVVRVLIEAAVDLGLSKVRGASRA